MSHRSYLFHCVFITRCTNICFAFFPLDLIVWLHPFILLESDTLVLWVYTVASFFHVVFVNV